MHLTNKSYVSKTLESSESNVHLLSSMKFEIDVEKSGHEIFFKLYLWDL